MSTRLLGVVILALCIAFTITASAQVTATISQQDQGSKPQEISPEKLALVKELLEALDIKRKSEAILDAMFEQMDKQRPEMIWQALSGMKELEKLTPAEQQSLRNEINESSARTSQRFRELIAQRINYGQMIEEISSELYAKYFSENDLKDIIVFYKSPAGQRTLEVMPSLLSESMAKASERMMPLIRDLMSEISTDETTKFQKRVASLVESHHKTATPRSKSLQRRPRTQ